MSHDYHVLVPPAKSGASHVCVGIEVRRAVVTRQLRGDDVMTCPL
jgi:hypothetical protein